MILEIQLKLPKKNCRKLKLRIDLTKIIKMNQEPKKELLRLGDILKWTGMSKRQLLKLVREGVLKGIKVQKNSRCLYRKSQVKKVLYLD